MSNSYRDASGGESSPDVLLSAYDQSVVASAIERYRAGSLSAVEDLLAGSQIALEALRRFKQEAARFRTEKGDAVAHSFARQELNDLIYELQDAIGPLLRTYNALLRDPSHEAGPPE